MIPNMNFLCPKFYPKGEKTIMKKTNKKFANRLCHEGILGEQPITHHVMFEISGVQSRGGNGVAVPDIHIGGKHQIKKKI